MCCLHLGLWWTQISGTALKLWNPNAADGKILVEHSKKADGAGDFEDELGEYRKKAAAEAYKAPAKPKRKRKRKQRPGVGRARSQRCRPQTSQRHELLPMRRRAGSCSRRKIIGGRHSTNISLRSRGHGPFMASGCHSLWCSSIAGIDMKRRTRMFALIVGSQMQLPDIE